MGSTSEPPFAPELVVDRPPHLMEEPVTEKPVRAWAPTSTEGHTTVSKLRADDIGHTLLLQAPHTPLSERVSWPGPRWVVVGELVAVSHREGATSLVLRVAGSEVRLDVDPDLQVEVPPRAPV